MSFSPDTPVLTVDTSILHKVDPSNRQDLFYTWTVFARSAKSVEKGRRLENISWRLWNQRQGSCASSRSISADDFEKMVVSIVKETQPFAGPRGQTTCPCMPQTSPSSIPSLEALSSESNPRTNVVRGFSPRVSSAVAKTTLQPTAGPVPSKKPVVFVMGGSYSSSEQDRAAPAPVMRRNRMCKLGGSTGKDHVDESAIDDDDSSDWEDSNEESGKSGIDDKTCFQRIDSKPNLTSRTSLITLMVAQNDRAMNLGNSASQPASVSPPRTAAQSPGLGVSPDDLDEAPLMMKRGVRSSPLKLINEAPRTAAQPINEVPRTAAQPITATASHSHLQAALSPRTSRRNMLSTELTESLRRHMLHERKLKSSTANAVLRRRHASHDVANLKQYPEKVCMNKSEHLPPEDQCVQSDSCGSYNSKGW